MSSATDRARLEGGVAHALTVACESFKIWHDAHPHIASACRSLLFGSTEQKRSHLPSHFGLAEAKETAITIVVK